MSVKTYSLKKLGKSYKVSEHFTLGEFACKDGSDTVLISSELLTMLEKLRSYGGFSITINSGYRTSSYNKKTGGASQSKHTQGYAADIVVKKNGTAVNSKLVCCLCQTLGFKGIGKMTTAVHVDMASRTYRGDEAKGYSNNVGGDFYKYFGITSAQVTALKASSSATASDGYSVKVTANSLNIRSGAGTKYSVTGTLAKGAVVKIVGINGDWGQLADGKGWIALKYTAVV